jgi:AraC-like DNA-binding protein
MTHNLNIFLLLFGALQSGLLSIWFLRNQRKKVANFWFATFLIVIGLQLTFKVVTKAWMLENIFEVYRISYRLPYLIGPLLYLYIRSRNHNRFYRTDLLHFIPFSVSVLVILLSTRISWLESLLWQPYTRAGVQCVVLGVYGYFSLRLGNVNLKPFIRMVVIAEAIIVITLAVMVIYYGRFPDVRLLFLLLTILIYWISYQAISKPDVFLQMENASIIPLNIKRNVKYAHSALKTDEAARIAGEIQQLMAHEKLYLNCDLTIDLLSARLKTSRHYLSQVLNEKLNKSYVEYVNDLRLEEAKSRLANPTHLKYTIAAIAFDCGFNSVSNFNETFRKRFGTTPSKFRQQQSQMSA